MKDLFIQDINTGMGESPPYLPIGFPKLEQYMGLEKNLYSIIFGSSGSGKSSLAQCMYILNPIDYLIANPDVKTKYHCIYFSLERSAKFVRAKWMIRHIFKKYGIYISLNRILGLKGDRMKADEHDLVIENAEYLDAISEMVTIYEGNKTTVDIDKLVKEHFNKNGVLEKISDYKYHYVENNPHLITNILVDHQSLVRKSGIQKTKKEAIDDTSALLQRYRDTYNSSCNLVAQMNRSMSSNIYKKGVDEFEPIPEDIKDSGSPAEDADLVLSLFDPLKFNTIAPTGHDALKLKDPTNFAKHYRSVKLHKNTYGADDIHSGMAFNGALGDYKELKKADLMTDEDYENVINWNIYKNFNSTHNKKYGGFEI